MQPSYDNGQFPCSDKSVLVISKSYIPLKGSTFYISTSPSSKDTEANTQTHMLLLLLLCATIDMIIVVRIIVMTLRASTMGDEWWLLIVDLHHNNMRCAICIMQCVQLL